MIYRQYVALAQVNFSHILRRVTDNAPIEFIRVYHQDVKR